MNIPNLITLGRILLVPIVVWAIATPGTMWIAFVLFLAAGVSDAVDGFLAKRFSMTTELGAYLDPLADKALIVSIYLTLGINDLIPRWLVILVVSRDILIVGGIMLSWLIGNPLKIKPLLVSKLNTVAQIVFACVVLGSLGFGIPGRYADGCPHGPGRGLDLAVDRRLSRRMGASHELGGGRTVSPRTRAAPRGARRRGRGVRAPDDILAGGARRLRAAAVAAERDPAAVRGGPRASPICSSRLPTGSNGSASTGWPPRF